MKFANWLLTKKTKLLVSVLLSLSLTFWVVGNCAASDTIKIGAPIPVTGPYAGDGQTMNDGILLAVEEINSQGGLLGRQLEMKIYDVEDLMPEKIFASAEKLVGLDKADFIITGWSGLGPDVQAYGKYDVPYLFGNSSIRCIEMIEANPNNWNLLQMTHHEAAYGKACFDGTMAIDYKFPNKKIALIAGDFEWDRLFLKGFKERAEAEGWEIVKFDVVPYGTREWGPILSKIRRYKPSLIVAEILSPPDLVTLYRQFKETPIDAVLQFGWSVYIAEFTELLGEEGDGILGNSPCSPIFTSDALAFNKKFEKRFNKKQSGTSGYVYQGVMAWAEAVRQVGKVDDYKAVIKYMRENPYEKRIVGLYDWRETQYAKTGPLYPNHIAQVQRGEVVDIVLGTDKIPGSGFQKPKWIKN